VHPDQTSTSSSSSSSRYKQAASHKGRREEGTGERGRRERDLKTKTKQQAFNLKQEGRTKGRESPAKQHQRKGKEEANKYTCLSVGSI
jgi:hypothetical protein